MSSASQAIHLKPGPTTHVRSQSTGDGNNKAVLHRRSSKDIVSSKQTTSQPIKKRDLVNLRISAHLKGLKPSVSPLVQLPLNT